jgi:hypothetical protein
MIRQRTCAPVDILCCRDRAVVTTFGRPGIRPAARPRRHFSEISRVLRLFFARQAFGKVFGVKDLCARRLRCLNDKGIPREIVADYLRWQVVVNGGESLRRGPPRDADDRDRSDDDGPASDHVGLTSTNAS